MPQQGTRAGRGGEQEEKWQVVTRAPDGWVECGWRRRSGARRAGRAGRAQPDRAGTGRARAHVQSPPQLCSRCAMECSGRVRAPAQTT